MASPNRPQRSHADYTVACICPMGVELAPVEAMLDEFHDPLPTNRDQNAYTLGSIGGHNIVIAVMPATGNNVATTVATQLLNDFPSVRFGLLVGIGGGVPGEADVRLGDLVISQPKDTFGGVVQYDMGKRLEDGRFQRTGLLRQPPAVLSANVRKLEAQYHRLGPNLSQRMGQMLQKYPAMRDKYSFPTMERDELFHPTYKHQSAPNCDQCDMRKIVTRPLREDNEPRIHYGTIASANILLKDAVLRDVLHKDMNVLCVEMEAAGIMNDFPCLIIRGICDYADSHKNKKWQPYAAAVAAAYMKDLLGIIPIQEVARTDRAIESTASSFNVGVNVIEAPRYGPVQVDSSAYIVQGNVAHNYHYLHEGLDGEENEFPGGRKDFLTSTFRRRRKERGLGGLFPGRNEEEDILDKLGFDNMDAKKNASMSEGLFDLDWVWSTPFSAWLEQSTDPFWICGKPGSGKSTLVAHIAHSKQTLDRLQSSGHQFRIIYYFYDYRGGKSTANNLEGMLRYFLFQLADAIPGVYERLTLLSNTQRLDLKSLPNLLYALCEALNMVEDRFCAFIDGMDEYGGSATAIVHICQELIKRTGLKICLASRPETGISRILSLHATILMQDFNKASMIAYANTKIIESEAVNINIAKQLKNGLVEELVQRAEGVILWFKLVFDQIITMLDQDASEEEITGFVENDAVPGLESLYERILAMIPPRWCPEAALTLWLIQELQSFSARNASFSASGITRELRSFLAENPSLSTSANARGLQFLTEVMNFLSDQLGTSIEVTRLKDHLELQSRMTTLLRGLINVVDETEDERVHSRIRLMHVTLPSFLSATQWVEKHINPRFFEIFPDNFMLRFSVMLFTEASADQVISPELLSRCTTELRVYGDTFTNLIAGKWWKAGQGMMKLSKMLILKRQSALKSVATALNPAILDFEPHDVGVVRFQKVFAGMNSSPIPFELSETWQQRNTILRALPATLLPLAAHLEGQGYSSNRIIAPVMKSYLRPWLGLSSLFQVDVADILVHFEDPEALKILDLILAVLVNLPIYFEERLKSARLTDYQQQILGFFVVRQCWHVDLDGSVRKLESFLVRSAVGDRSLNSEILCQFMDLCCPRKYATNYDILNGFLVPGEVRTTKEVHHQPFCKQGRGSNLLVDWAILACYKKDGAGCCGTSEKYVAQWRSCLDLVLKTGVDVNAPVYARGNVIHAVLDFDLIITQHERGCARIVEKFTSLAQRGLDPNIASRYGTAIKAAKALKVKLDRKRTAKKYGNWVSLTLVEVDWVIRQLETYNQTGGWHEEVEAWDVPPANTGGHTNFGTTPGRDTERGNEAFNRVGPENDVHLQKDRDMAGISQYQDSNRQEARWDESIEDHMQNRRSSASGCKDDAQANSQYLSDTDQFDGEDTYHYAATHGFGSEQLAVGLPHPSVTQSESVMSYSGRSEDANSGYSGNFNCRTQQYPARRTVTAGVSTSPLAEDDHFTQAAPRVRVQDPFSEPYKSSASTLVVATPVAQEGTKIEELGLKARMQLRTGSDAIRKASVKTMQKTETLKSKGVT